MNRDEILKASRKEHQNKDLPELEISSRAGAIAMQVGAFVCILLVILTTILTDTILYSPWIIYFSILGTNWIVRFVNQKRVSDLVVSITFFTLMILAMVLFILRLMGGGV